MFMGLKSFTGRPANQRDRLAFDSTADFLNTITWGGIQSISVGVVEITDPYMAIGIVSGINWTTPANLAAPVPAPACWLLFSVGLAILAFTRRAVIFTWLTALLSDGVRKLQCFWVKLRITFAG